jgi:hypothetical protein
LLCRLDVPADRAASARIARHPSPNADAIDRALRFDGNVVRLGRCRSIPSTLRAATVTTMVAAMFWIMREVSVVAGARRLVQAVAWSGLDDPVVALLTRAYRLI